VTVPSDDSLYYQGRYWNDLPAVAAAINERISGDASVGWLTHFATTADRRYARALSLNCGNGWVERDLLRCGVADEVVGVDYSEDLLAQASDAAGAEGFAARYVRMDVNTANFPAEPFDLVVAHAALHHVTWIDRVVREICTLLPDDGTLVTFDYVGAHRNLYAHDTWAEVAAVNRRLPEGLRRDLESTYIRVEATIAGDPTEAVHSELVVPTLRHYFEIDEFTPVGGAIAYPLLTHNPAFFAGDPGAHEEWIALVMEEDARHLREHPEASLFAYVRGRPRKAALADRAELRRRETDERAREAEAAKTAGRYYPPTPFHEALHALDQARNERDALAAELEHVRSSTTWRLGRALTRLARPFRRSGVTR